MERLEIPALPGIEIPKAEKPQKTWKPRKPDPHDWDTRRNPLARQYRKLSGKMVEKEPEGLNPDGEPIDFKALGVDPYLMGIPEADGQISLPNELSLWWWSEGWEKTLRPDGTACWPGIDRKAIVRTKHNPLLPDAGCRATMLRLPLSEWPVKAILAATIEASKHSRVSYTELIQSARDVWERRELIGRLLKQGFIPVPVVNMTLFPPRYRKDHWPPLSDYQQQILAYQARHLPGFGREIWWIAVDINTSKTYPAKLAEVPGVARHNIFVESLPVLLWTTKVLEKLHSLYPDKFPDSNWGCSKTAGRTDDPGFFRFVEIPGSFDRLANVTKGSQVLLTEVTRQEAAKNWQLACVLSPRDVPAEALGATASDL